MNMKFDITENKSLKMKLLMSKRFPMNINNSL